MLGLHGDGFTGVDRCLADLSMPATVVRVDSAQPLGAALNSAVAASGGTLLTKMDDDDAYGCEHLWDLVLAHEYSQAHLVEKTQEFHVSGGVGHDRFGCTGGAPSSTA